MPTPRTNDDEERLSALRADLERQNLAWQQTLRALGSLGDVSIAVPHELLEQFEGLLRFTVRPRAGVRA